MTDPQLVHVDDWQNRAACRDADPRIFFPNDAWDETPDPPYPTREADRYCTPCPVRAECLTRALNLNLEGTWGGTTAYQRDQLRRPRARVTCPVCNARNMAVIDAVEMCLGCGASWNVGRA